MVSSTRQSGRYFLRSTGAPAPVLGLAQSYWALLQRPGRMVEAVAKGWDEGFHYFEAGLREDRMPEIHSILKAAPVQLIAQGWAVTAAEAVPFFQRAADLSAVAINLHLGHAYLSHAQAVALLEEVQELAQHYEIPLLLETHRGRMTQDLFRTSALSPYMRDTSMVLDVSHYVVAGEGFGGDEQRFHELLQPLLERTAMIHGRISNGQQVQVEASSLLAFTAMIQQVWQRAMELWLQDAPQDAVLIFEPELGPPPYAYVLPDGSETFNRDEESRAVAALGRAAWAAAQAAQEERA